MFKSSNDEYINATKNARVNTYDNREISIRLWFINFSLFSLLVIGSYYSYFYFNTNSHQSHSTIVMGVSHTYTSDNDLMVKLYNIEVDKIDVEKENISITDAMKKIVDASSLENSSKYVEELATEELSTEADSAAIEKEEKITFEKRISNELKLIN